MSSTQVDSSYYYGTSRSKYGAEVVGYVVEVSVGGRIVASEIMPIDTKKKIEATKAPRKGDNKDAPPVHKF